MIAIFFSAFGFLWSLAHAPARETIARIRSGMGRYSTSPSSFTCFAAIGIPWMIPSNSGIVTEMEISIAFIPSGDASRSSFGAIRE